MLTYFFWCVAALLAVPAIAGIALGIMLMVLGVAAASICCVPLGLWLVLADAKFWKSLTHGKVERN